MSNSRRFSGAYQGVGTDDTGFQQSRGQSDYQSGGRRQATRFDDDQWETGGNQGDYGYGGGQGAFGSDQSAFAGQRTGNYQSGGASGNTGARGGHDDGVFQYENSNKTSYGNDQTQYENDHFKYGRGGTGSGYDDDTYSANPAGKGYGSSTANAGKTGTGRQEKEGIFDKAKHMLNDVKGGGSNSKGNSGGSGNFF